MTEPNWQAIAEQAVEVCWRVARGDLGSKAEDDARKVIVIYEAATHKPDAAKMAAVRIETLIHPPGEHGSTSAYPAYCPGISVLTNIIREEIARDNAERDAKVRTLVEVVETHKEWCAIGNITGSFLQALSSRG